MTAAGLLVALGIIYGDIGTSPLYVFNSIIKDRVVDETLILGTLSLIIWTITMLTTVKYVVMVLRADRSGDWWRRMTRNKSCSVMMPSTTPVTVSASANSTLTRKP